MFLFGAQPKVYLSAHQKTLATFGPRQLVRAQDSKLRIKFRCPYRVDGVYRAYKVYKVYRVHVVYRDYRVYMLTGFAGFTGLTGFHTSVIVNGT